MLRQHGAEIIFQKKALIELIELMNEKEVQLANPKEQIDTSIPN